MEPLIVLANSSDLSQSLLGFLDEHFKTREDLSNASNFVEILKKEYVDLDRNLTNLQKKFTDIVSVWVSRSKDTRRALYQLDLKLKNRCFCSIQDERGEQSSKRMGKILTEELPLLATEVRRIETVRVYAETALRLEALVGDLEDVARLFMSPNPRNIFAVNFSNPTTSNSFGWKQENLLLSIKAIKDIEDNVTNIVKHNSKWSRLLTAVDSRVDQTLANLRPQAIADHRTLLVSLGWPPPLLSTTLDREKSLEFRNPLVLMQGDVKEGYFQSFLALCDLQQLQMQRQVRRLNFSTRKKESHSVDCADWHEKLCLHQGLWAIDELVFPVSSRMERYFSRWVDDPKFIFAFVYKITRDFAGGLDEILQPLIDKARLRGHSAKEDWVSAMAKMLRGYLTKQIFPVLANRYDKNRFSEVSSLWLHLVDLIIAFNKQMLAVARSVTEIEFDGNYRGISISSIFCDRPDWLKIWAEIELLEAEAKLNSELEEVRAWTVDIKKDSGLICERDESFLLSTREDFKAPLVAERVIKITWGMIEKSRSLPEISSQILFTRLAPARFLHLFLDVLRLRCWEVELSIYSSDDDALKIVVGSINAARYCESVLREWCEDMNLLEMGIAEDNSNNGSDLCGCIFVHEIESLKKLQTDWLAEIMALLLRQFNSLSWDYIRNKKPWEQAHGDYHANQDLGSKELTISVEFVEALVMLNDQLSDLKMILNSKDFLDLWRSVAGGLDHFIFSIILLNDSKFAGHGMDQFVVDMGGLFSIFRPFCARPESFFPFTSNSLKLLTMNGEDTKNLLAVLSKGDGKMECLKQYGVFHVSENHAKKILRNKEFGN